MRSQDPKPDPDRALLIACGALARETLAVIRASRFDHLSVTCLPAILHNRPDRIPDRLRQRIRTARAQGFGRIFVLYADCGTGGAIDRVCAQEGVERIAGPHCYAFYAGQPAFDAMMDEEIGSFFLTDYLVRHFDRLIVEGLGLDRHPELRDMVFGHYRRLVYLAQTDDPNLAAKARAAADRLGLTYEHRPTGYGELAGFVRMAATAGPPSSPTGEKGACGVRQQGDGAPPLPVARARALRRNATDAEYRLWRVLKSRQVDGWKFRRQVPFGAHTLNFVCFEARLVVEVDDGQHAAPRDADDGRTAVLTGQGFDVLRFRRSDVLGDLDHVLDVIRGRLAAPSPHPAPLPRGESGAKANGSP